MSGDLVKLVMAREPLPTGPSVFLAGPTPERGTIPSWRPVAVDELATQWAGRHPGTTRLAVLSPESRHDRRAPRYEDQVVLRAVGRVPVRGVEFRRGVRAGAGEVG